MRTDLQVNDWICLVSPDYIQERPDWYKEAYVYDYGQILEVGPRTANDPRPDWWAVRVENPDGQVISERKVITSLPVRVFRYLASTRPPFLYTRPNDPLRYMAFVPRENYPAVPVVLGEEKLTPVVHGWVEYHYQISYQTLYNYDLLPEEELDRIIYFIRKDPIGCRTEIRQHLEDYEAALKGASIRPDFTMKLLVRLHELGLSVEDILKHIEERTRDDD